MRFWFTPTEPTGLHVVRVLTGLLVLSWLLLTFAGHMESFVGPQGWMDALRTLYPDEAIYTLWDYFRNAFARNAGIRIDHFLLAALERITSRARSVWTAIAAGTDRTDIRIAGPVTPASGRVPCVSGYAMRSMAVAAHPDVAPT